MLRVAVGCRVVKMQFLAVLRKSYVTIALAVFENAIGRNLKQLII